MDIVLSSDSDALICVLYAEYLSRRSHGVSIDRALSFNSDQKIHENFLPDWHPEDVTTVCFWLYDRGLISFMEGDMHCLDVCLTEDGIIYMESRFARKREAVIAHLKELLNLGVSIALNVLH